MGEQLTVGALSEFPDGELHTVQVAGRSLVVARDGDTVCAAVNRCPHMGLPLSRGPGGVRFADGVVQCPWHNSRFELCSGRNLDWASGFAGRSAPRWSRRLIALGRPPSPLTTVPARVVDGAVVVELDPADPPGPGRE
jgi:nitrite reductase/ring-hydroxylating ferredoxin subunit